MAEYDFPWWTSIWWVICVFAASLILFHGVFVWFGSLTSVGWKRVDYIWISLAFLGVLGTVDQSYSLYASNYAELAQPRSKASFEGLMHAVTFGHSSAICRKFQRSALTPPEHDLQKIQREYDAQCTWFKQLEDAMSKIDPHALPTIDLSKLAPPFPTGGDPWAYELLQRSLARYHDAQQAVAALSRDAKKSDHQGFLLVLGSMLLPIAVALRLTKVTGEIRIERSRSSAGV